MGYSTDKGAIHQTLLAILNHKLLVLAVFFLVVSTGMVTTFLITPKYEATMSILISRDKIDFQVSPSEKLPDVSQKAISDEEFNSELELVKSSEVISSVVKELDLINNQTPKNDSWASILRARIKTALCNSTKSGATVVETKEGVNTKDNFTIEKAVNRVLGNLDVVPIKKSRIIKVKYTDTDPIRAKQTLERIYEKYVELHVRLNEKQQTGEVFNEQSATFDKKLKSSTNSLKNFDVQNEIAGSEIGVQRELLLKQMFDAQTQLNSTQAEIVESQQRINDLQQKVNAQPDQIQTVSVSKYVLAIDRMKEEIVQLEQQRTQLLQKYQPKSRIVRDNEERIEQLKKSLAEEIASPPQEKSVAINDLKRKLLTELFNAQTNLVALREREKTLSPLLARLRGQSAQFNSKSIERGAIEREKNINEEAFLLYQKKARENEISQVLNKELAVNSSAVDPPRTDGEPKNPKPLLNLLVLIGIGLISGVASAIALDKFTLAEYDRRLIKSPNEIEQRWNLPVLASIPVIESPRTIKLLPEFKQTLLTAPLEPQEENNPG